MRHPALLLALTILAPLAAAEYLVAPDGDDTGAGSREAPWRTIQHAAERLGPGDTCLIRGGTYRETVRPARSGEPGRPIRFVAWPGEVVTVSGAGLLDAWSAEAGGLFRAACPPTVQLFCDGLMMPEARWPNLTSPDPMVPAWATAQPGTGYDGVADARLPPGDWAGAVVLIWPGARWTNHTRRVTDYRPGEGFRFDHDFRPKQPDPYHTSDPRQPRAGNPYYLFGVAAALDAPGEWLHDNATLRFMPPGGSPAGHRIEVKQRPYAFDLSERQAIELQGLRIFAAALNLDKARDCLVQDCHFRYIDHYRTFEGDRAPDGRFVVTGANNELRRCSFVYAAGSALRIAGEGNRLIDSVVREANYLGTYQGAVDLRNAVGAVVDHCSIYRGGRDLIQHHGAKRIKITWCDLWGANMLNHDSGATYAWGTDGEGSEIAYNWVHDNLGELTCGIYLDNFCKNHLVHHNLVWNNSNTGIRLNSDAVGHLVANNTVAGNSAAVGTFTYHGRVPTMQGTRIVNNLFVDRFRPDDPGMVVQGELGPELRCNGPAAIGQDGVPRPGSAAIDAGVELPGITDGFAGRAPDLGAYETARPIWRPGASWRDEGAPPAPAMDLTFQPLPPLTEANMLTAGLALWLDAADADSVERDADGAVRRWRDRSGRANDALPTPGGRFVLTEAMGRTVVRGHGAGALKVGSLRGTPGPFSLYLVSQGPEAAGPEWQRLISSFNGTGNDWTAPNWCLVRAGGAQPAGYGPRLFAHGARADHSLANVTLAGSAQSNGQFLAGDLAEVLLYERLLSPAEQDAVEAYLARKWGL